MEDIVKVASNYFDNLFSARLCDQMDKCLDAVSCKVTPDMQNILSSEFNAEDIKTTLFQMGPTKTPGPDGMNVIFQNFWHIMGDSVGFF